MIKHKYFFLSSLLFFISCVPPKQPALSKLEETFIEELQKKYNCKVERNIDSYLLTKESGGNHVGSYNINVNLQCDSLIKFGKDSLKIRLDAIAIAKRLYTEVLEKNSKFKEIWVSFSCDTSNSKYKDLIFVYKSDSLKNNF